MSISYICRACGSENTEKLGALPKTKKFAGERLKSDLPASSLYICKSCSMLARHPILNKTQYNQLYAQSKPDVWLGGMELNRQDHLITKALTLKKLKPNDKVLDIGCYCGDLLASLPNNVFKYGIEMSESAARVAERRGIVIIGNDMYKIESKQKFNLLVAVDVIEHTENPEEFLNNLLQLLDADGEIIISTGNTDNKLWRKLKNRFWYASFPEHISFIGETWIEKFSKKYDLILGEKVLFSHLPSCKMSNIKTLIKKIFMLNYLMPTKFSNTSEDHICFSLKIKTKGN